MHRLAVLVGKTPDALVAELTPTRALPELPAKLDAGTPGELLRRRPDIAAAEPRLPAAPSRIGAAPADLFPRLALGGPVGIQAFDTLTLVERHSLPAFIAPGTPDECVLSAQFGTHSALR